MYKVSVIIPIYGVEKYIERCAKSLFAQTLDDIEFIFIDDCSPDTSMELLNKEIEKNRPRFAGKNWEVRTVRMPANGGLTAVRRHGIQLATGQYIIHCDSDDWVEPDAYRLLYEKAVKDCLDIVFCDLYRSTEDRKELWVNKCEDGMDKDYYMRKLLSRKCFSAVWNKLVKRSLYDNPIDYPKCNMWEDYVLSTQVFFYASQIGYLNKPLYNYYINQQSICHWDPTKKQEQININSKIILDFLERKDLTRLYKNEIVSFKNTAREELLTSLNDTQYRKMWLSVYPEINSRYFFTSGIGVKDKLRFIIILLGLYPFVIRQKRA